VSPNGKRFLALIPEFVADELPLTVVLNWTGEAAQKDLAGRLVSPATPGD
jgi:hypothetical protein